jgi:hypothetical protein
MELTRLSKFSTSKLSSVLLVWHPLYFLLDLSEEFEVFPNLPYEAE